MTFPTAALGCILCVVCAKAQDDRTATIACNLKAIGAAKRARYNDLMKQLRSTVLSRSELPNGYTLTLDSRAIKLQEVAEWMGMERLCCPFLTLQLSASGSQAGWLLKLTGPGASKALLGAEFQTR